MAQVRTRENRDVAVEDGFFAPVDHDAIDALVARRDQDRQRVSTFAAFVHGGEYRDAVQYFLNANPDAYNRYTRHVDEIFDEPRTLAYVDACYWRRVLDLTDVFECMPQARREEWNDAIDKRETPEFTDDTVRATLSDLLAARHRFLAEKADGIFRALSRNHVTNQPEGFGRRFILEYCFEYGGAGYRSAGILVDLRAIVAKFMGREPPQTNSTSRAMEFARNRRRGEWVALDGGAIRIRAYKKGTVHIEVHPDMTWRLNCLLHELHPAAIPSRHRKPPTRTRDFPPVFDRPLPTPVARMLENGDARGESFRFGAGFNDDPVVKKQAVEVLELIGGVQESAFEWKFDYEPDDTIREIAASGVVPDRAAHQYYPTPQAVADAVIRLADLAPGQWILEPSAGQGALLRAAVIATDGQAEIHGVEINPIHAKISQARASVASVVCSDFMEYVPTRRYDRVVMNPPFSRGRALAHLERAYQNLLPGGRLVAVLPAGYQNKALPVPGYWGPEFCAAFPGTRIDVALYVVDKPKRETSQ